MSISSRKQKAGACPFTDEHDKDRIVLSAVFGDNKIVLVKKHALKHVDTLNLNCKEDIEAIKHLIMRALYNGRVIDGRKSMELLDSYTGRGAITFVGKRSNGEHYCITGDWQAESKILTIFQICRCDRTGCLY